MAQVKVGDTVRVNYIGRLGDGTIFDMSKDRGPLEFKVGSGQVIPGFDRAVVGMRPGETKSFIIPAADAYGPYLEEMVGTIPRHQLPTDMNPQVGEQLGIQQQDGQEFVVNVVDVTDANITVDGNHPLAGEDLTFDIQLVEIL